MAYSGDIVDKIIALETGQLDNKEIVDLFVELANDGTIWQLQGKFGRGLESLVHSGWIVKEGGQYLSNYDAKVAEYENNSR